MVGREEGTQPLVEIVLSHPGGVGMCHPGGVGMCHPGEEGP